MAGEASAAASSGIRRVVDETVRRSKNQGQGAVVARGCVRLDAKRPGSVNLPGRLLLPIQGAHHWHSRSRSQLGLCDHRIKTALSSRFPEPLPGNSTVQGVDSVEHRTGQVVRYTWNNRPARVSPSDSICSFTYGDDTASTCSKRAEDCPAELPGMLVNLVRNTQLRTITRTRWRRKRLHLSHDCPRTLGTHETTERGSSCQRSG